MDSNAIVSMTGPPLLGIFANWSLFGVISSQVYIYSQAFPNDRRAIKVLVYGVYTLNIIQTSFLTETSWTMFASGYGNIKNLDKLGTSWLSVGVIGGIVELLVQLFYVYRIFVLSQSMVVTASILFVSISSFAAAIFNSVFAAKVGHLSALVARTSPTYVSTGVMLGAGSVCDVLILICQCYYLRSRSQYVKVESTRAVVSKTIRLTIEAGALTALSSIAALVLFYIPIPSVSKYYTLPVISLAKIYSTSMLAVLNSRMKLGIISGSDVTWQESGQQSPLSSLRFDVKPERSASLTSISTISSQCTDIFGEVQGMRSADKEKYGGIMEPSIISGSGLIWQVDGQQSSLSHTGFIATMNKGTDTASCSTFSSQNTDYFGTREGTETVNKEKYANV